MAKYRTLRPLPAASVCHMVGSSSPVSGQLCIRRQYINVATYSRPSVSVVVSRQRRRWSGEVSRELRAARRHFAETPQRSQRLASYRSNSPTQHPPSRPSHSSPRNLSEVDVTEFNTSTNPVQVVSVGLNNQTAVTTNPHDDKDRANMKETRLHHQRRCRQWQASGRRRRPKPNFCCRLN